MLWADGYFRLGMDTTGISFVGGCGQRPDGDIACVYSSMDKATTRGRSLIKARIARGLTAKRQRRKIRDGCLFEALVAQRLTNSTKIIRDLCSKVESICYALVWRGHKDLRKQRRYWYRHSEQHAALGAFSWREQTLPHTRREVRFDVVVVVVVVVAAAAVVVVLYLTSGERKTSSWANAFHTWRLEWTPDHLTTFVDNQQIMRITPNFWQKGGFSGSNIWGSGERMAPFDQEFYLMVNVAVGGTSGFFPDGNFWGVRKPWANSSPQAAEDFWNGRNDWLPTWQGEKTAMLVDYVEFRNL
ncbi:beta-1,3-glucan binding protein [Plakobranchus ocellatus]|uniref:Beta-1,3-glucan binding protein n=1 Tax=Plakobranchus ocellatus TaxID=259542 RepID=A0AAV3XVP6_9GAST|nr:beta-1,3-glucan binding protein [Plakobranchus ocellatus]